ncbi:unnamed protein product [Microthlaspi erraticum]|uniref:BHLH domain-containing protein n=1 Tax=Microthlaspi erraticum TaxID=1685480 RepID=A0A6D2IS77_9BRAS|nr:unnamed protein product [Microthlaspi erraticum]
MSSEVKQILKSLCFSHGWSYAVFWRYDPIDPMLLRLEEAHNDEKSAAVVDDMNLQAHILGQGLVGEAALTGNHQWLFSDTLFQCEHEFQNQFLSGFKTIAIIPVGSSGVVQLGSTQKVVESREMLDQTRRAVEDMCLKQQQDQSVDLDALFESLVPLGDSDNIVPETLQGLSFDDIFADDNPPSLLSPEMMMVVSSDKTTSEAPLNPDDQTNIGDDFGFDILNSYSLDDLYQLLADSPPQQNCSLDDDDHHQETSMVIQGNDKDLFDMLGITSEDSSSASHEGFGAMPPKGLFSELISTSLSNSNSTCTSLPNVQQQDYYSGLNQSKRRKLESSSAHSSSSFFPQMMYEEERERVRAPPLNNDPQRSLWIDEERSSVGGNWKKPHEEGVKKKRAKAGESRRPRPKDRQMIQDRIKELRGMIPNGSKCSIDTLLDLTIRHMVFMQSVAKYADKLKQPYEPKLVKEKERTWAVEVGDGDEPVACPIIVEEMKPQGLVQIEMMMESGDQFLEIADVVRETRYTSPLSSRRWGFPSPPSSVSGRCFDRRLTPTASLVRPSPIQSPSAFCNPIPLLPRSPPSFSSCLLLLLLLPEF